MNVFSPFENQAAKGNKVVRDIAVLAVGDVSKACSCVYPCSTLFHAVSVVLNGGCGGGGGLAEDFFLLAPVVVFVVATPKSSTELGLSSFMGDSSTCKCCLEPSSTLAKLVVLLLSSGYRRGLPLLDSVVAVVFDVAVCSDVSLPLLLLLHRPPLRYSAIPPTSKDDDESSYSSLRVGRISDGIVVVVPLSLSFLSPPPSTMVGGDSGMASDGTVEVLVVVSSPL